MQAQLFKGTAPEHIQNYQESQPTENNKSARGQVQQHIALIRNHVLQPAQYIEAGIIKGSYRMKQTDPQCFQRRIVADKHDKAQNRSCALKAKCHEKHILYQPHHSL